MEFFFSFFLLASKLFLLGTREKIDERHLFASLSPPFLLLFSRPLEEREHTLFLARSPPRARCCFQVRRRFYNERQMTLFFDCFPSSTDAPLSTRSSLPLPHRLPVSRRPLPALSLSRARRSSWCRLNTSVRRERC